MFVRCAVSVAVTAVRNLARMGGEQILALYLKQATDKRSMAQFGLRIGGKVHKQWKIMSRRYVWKGRVKGHLAHLGASGLLICGDTQLPAIHHGPLRP